jgi:hypothetical protein
MFSWRSFVFVVGASGDDAAKGATRLGFVPRAYITVGSSDKSAVSFSNASV